MYCVLCGKEVRGFGDELSLKEYYISFTCADCQRKLFPEVPVGKGERFKVDEDEARKEWEIKKGIVMTAAISCFGKCYNPFTGEEVV